MQTRVQPLVRLATWAAVVFLPLFLPQAVKGAAPVSSFPDYRDMKVYTTSIPDAKNPARIVARTEFINTGQRAFHVSARLPASRAIGFAGGKYSRAIAPGKNAVWTWKFSPPAGIAREILTGAIAIDGRLERALYIAVQGQDPAGFADERVEKITERARVTSTYAPRALESIAAEIAQIEATRPAPILTLAAAGNTDYAILVDALPAVPEGREALEYWRALPNLTEPQKELVDAVEDLQRCVFRQTGALLPVRTMTDGPAIILRQADPGVAEGLQDAYRLHTAGGNVLIEAQDADGLRNGIYGLLTDHLDCHWFQPRELGEEIIIPADNAVRLPALDEAQGSPWFSAAGVSCSFAARWDRQLRSTINRGRMTFGHSWITYINPAEYPFDKFPEYYARDRQGKLIRRDASSYDGVNFCTTNPEVIEIVARKVNEFFAANPDAVVKSLDPNDCAPLCLCDRCLAIDKQYGQTREDGREVADRLIHFSNEIARRLEPQYRNKFLGILAYAFQRELPKSARPEGNYASLICDGPPEYDHGRPWNDPTSAVNRDFYRLVKGWGSIADQLGYYDYYGHFYYFGPWAILQKIREDLPAFHELGGTFVLFECQPNFAMQGLNHYVAGRLVWDLHADVDLLREEFFRKYYGPAADPMRRFWMTEERYFALERPGCYTETRVAAHPEFWSDLEECLQEAEKAVDDLPAGDQRFKDRIIFNRDGFDYGRMHYEYSQLNGTAHRTNSSEDHAAALKYLQDHRARFQEVEQKYASDHDPYWPSMVRTLFFLNVEAQMKAHQPK